MNEEDRQLFAELKDAITGRDKKILGFKLPELAIVVTFLVGVGLNWANFIELRGQTKWLLEFSRNSDTFQSAITGTEFNQGKPSDPTYYSYLRKIAQASQRTENK